MPSVGTQTGWSWVQDQAEIERLAQSYGADLFSCVLRGPGEAGPSSSRNGCHGANTAPASLTLPPILTQGDTRGVNKKSRTVTFPTLSPDKEEGDASRDVTLRPVSGDSHATSHDATANEDSTSDTVSHGVALPSLSENRESLRECFRDTATQDASLPPVPLDSHTALQDATPSVTQEDSPPPTTVASGDGDIPLLSVFDQLEQIDYSEQEDSSSDDSDNVISSGGDKEEGSDSEDEMIPENPNIPDLQPVAQLSWPTVLQYVKESESRLNQYFSLDNRETVGTRTSEAAKAMLYQGKDDMVTSPVGDSLGQSSESREDSVELAGAERDGSLFCHFCGRRLPRRSLLMESQDIEKMKEQDYFCCAEYKEYKVLVAVCMRQMVEKMRTAPPEKILLKHNIERANKKLLEERALTILRRKRRLEDIRWKREQEAEAKRQPKGTKTIQFTLDSPSELQQGWAVKQKAAKARRNHREKKAAAMKRRRNTEERLEMFSADTLERLKALAHHRYLEKRLFSDGKTYLTILPDRTGHCNYPSGRKAVVFFSLYEGVLAYMVYEDSDHPQLLACADELGRSCCYYLNGKVRFLCIPQLMVQFDASSQQTRRKIKWSTADATLFQPVSIPLNKHVTFKCNQESASLTLSFPHDHIKFSISSKLLKDEEPRYCSQLLSTIEAAEAVLTRTRARIGQLLHLLQNISQIQKLSKLESLYGTPMSKGARNPQGTSSGPARKKTRSVGAITLRKSNTENSTKHTRALTSDAQT